jgi:hypothetical protein
MNVGSEVLTSVVMKSSVSGDVKPYCYLLHTGVLFVFLFKPESGDDIFLRNTV